MSGGCTFERCARLACGGAVHGEGFGEGWETRVDR